MSKPVTGVVLAVVMVALIVGLDVSLFRDRRWFWERLATNVAVIVLFGALYFRFVGGR